MKMNNLIVIFGAFWCHQFHEIATAPSAPFKPSQPLPGPLDHADQLAISYLQKEAAREKRGSASGSGDILQHIKKSIGQGIKNKIGQLAKSSAGASAYFSKSSSGHQGHGYGHVPYDSGHYSPPHYYPAHHADDDHHGKPFDIWTLKKSVLYTLLQAVKAIKGGVIAIKGQLIKGGGHLLTAKGKLIRGGGEALTTIGKNIASSAFMWVPDSHEGDEHEVHAEEHYEQAGGYGHSAPSGPAHDVPVSGPAGHYGGVPSGTGGYHYQNSVYQDGGYERDRSYATFDPYY